MDIAFTGFVTSIIGVNFLVRVLELRLALKRSIMPPIAGIIVCSACLGASTTILFLK